MKTMKKIAATIGVVVSLTACDAQSACAPSDVVGRWHVDIEANPFGAYTRQYVAIDAQGKMDGLIRILDRTGIEGWSLRSVTPIKVGTNCKVSGQFSLSYPGSEYRGYAFFTDGAMMTADKNQIIGKAFPNPGYDTVPIENSTIRVTMIKMR